LLKAVTIEGTGLVTTVTVITDFGGDSSVAPTSQVRVFTKSLLPTVKKLKNCWTNVKAVRREQTHKQGTIIKMMQNEKRKDRTPSV
jgi:hypothetical protein